MQINCAHKITSLINKSIPFLMIKLYFCMFETLAVSNVNKQQAAEYTVCLRLMLGLVGCWQCYTGPHL